MNKQVKSGKQHRRYELKQYLVLSLPALILYSFMIVALGMTIHLSFHRWNGALDKIFVGLQNYYNLFREERFLYSIRNIFILISATIIIQLGLGILLAFICTQQIKGKEFFKIIIFSPVVISNVAIIAFFIRFFGFYDGYLNMFIGFVGIEPQNWFGLGKNQIFICLIPQTWQYIGLMFVIVLSGFTSVAQDYIEAGKLEGLNSWQILYHIYIPVSWHTIQICFILAMVGPLKNFVHIWLFNEGGTDQLSHIPGTLMYKIGFEAFNMGYGSAIAVVICILAGLLVFVFQRLFSRSY